MEKREVAQRLEANGDLPSVYSSDAIKKDSSESDAGSNEYWDPSISKKEKTDFPKFEHLKGFKVWKENTDR